MPNSHISCEDRRDGLPRPSFHSYNPSPAFCDLKVLNAHPAGHSSSFTYNNCTPRHPACAAMDHLCPRLSFPLAPCLSCLSQTTVIPKSATRTSRRTSVTPSLFGVTTTKTHPTSPSKTSTEINPIVPTHMSSQVPFMSKDLALAKGSTAVPTFREFQSPDFLPPLVGRSAPEQRIDSATIPPVPSLTTINTH